MNTRSPLFRFLAALAVIVVVLLLLGLVLNVSTAHADTGWNGTFAPISQLL